MNACCSEYETAISLYEQTISVLAADLAERIVDQVSAADQDWRAIERSARELAKLAATRVGGAREVC